MAVYKRTYKAYTGPLTPSWSRFTVLSRYGFATLFQSRPFTAYTVICMIPFLVGLAFIYLVNSPSVQTLLGLRQEQYPIIGNTWFMGFLGVEAFMAFILMAWGAPGMVSKDFANHSIQLYLSRPLSRAEYLAGKVSVLAALLSLTTWVPALILFFVQASLHGNGWLGQNLWMAGSIIVASLMWIAVVSLLAMACAVWVRWRIAATGLLLGTFFVLPGVGEVMNAILRTSWGRLLSISYDISMVWSHLFRLSDAARRGGDMDRVPLWAAWAALLAVCALSLWMLVRRLKAREVERA
jgi:ABC-type transport system involved in multi-copper enzyme maturation permease subunit